MAPPFRSGVLRRTGGIHDVDRGVPPAICAWVVSRPCAVAQVVDQSRLPCLGTRTELGQERASMLVHQVVGQPGQAGGPPTNVRAISDLIVTPGVIGFDAAVAYVTDGGVDALLRTVNVPASRAAWSRLAKRFLVSVDWCRSDPTALERLAAIPNAQVRVHDGARVVMRTGCVPHLPWHPKWFSVYGPSVRGVLCGSGNLSRNGLSKGHEAGLLQIVRSPRTAAERTIEASLANGATWFDRHWRAGTALVDVLPPYRTEFARHPIGVVGRSEDASDGTDAASRTRGLRPEQIAKLSSATNLWIAAGTLSRNRGEGVQGNQLMMSAMTRVFFGVEPRVVPKNTHFESIVIEHPSNPGKRIATTLRFSHNSMDVLGLPVPSAPWPSAYDGKTLLFTKVARGTALHYILSVGSTAGALAWQRRSAGQGSAYKMQSGREWGVFS